MKNIFKKSLFFMMGCLLATNIWAAAPAVISLPTPTTEGDNKVYTYSTATEIKVKSVEAVWFEIPAGNLSGDFYVKGSGANDSRFLYIHKDHGATKDESRKIVFKKEYQSFAFTANDIKTDGGKYYLVFSTTDDYKMKEECAKLTTGASQGGDEGGGDEGGGDEGGGDEGGGDEGGGDEGGGEEPAPGENENLLIKGTSQQEASGPAAGSVVTNLSKKDAVKLDKKKHFGVSLKDGYTLEEGDIFVINITKAADLGTCMLYADKDGSELLYNEGTVYSGDSPSKTGEKRIALPAAVAGKTAIYLWREDGTTQWNPTFNYIAVYRNGEIPGPASTAVTGVTLDKVTAEVEIGKTVTLTATVAPADATNKNISWSSDNTAVATVANGKVTGVAEGEATISVKTEDGEFTASCKVTVKKAEEGGGDQPGGGDEPGGNSIFDWIIAGSNKIENDGTDLSQAEYGTLNVGTSVTGRLLGENAIEYNSKGYKLANNDVCIEIQGTSAFQAGDVVTITGVCGGSGERGFTVAPSSSASASSGDFVLTNLIDNTEVNNFTATITDKQAGDKLRIFRLAGKTMYLSAIKVERGGSTPIEDVDVTGVTLNKTTLTLEAGQTETLTATVAPDNATNKKVTWSSNNTSVATVDETGKVSALAEGSATITVTTEDQGKTATCAVTVTAPATPIEVVSISIKASTTLQEGESETLSVTYNPSNANTGKAITWSSDKPSIAKVDANGKVTAVAAGTATITATTENGKTATCAVTVTEATPIPQTDLNLHVPEIYEAREIAGGYGGVLRVVDKYEYEVYYTGKTSDSKASVCIFPNTQKQDGITENDTKSVKAKDGWFKGTMNGGISNCSLSENAEFEAGSTNAYHKMTSNDSYKFHVKGYQQFAFLGKDKKTDTSSKQDKPQNNQLFEVYIDDVLQDPQTNTSSITARRYDITSKEHVIEVRAINGGNSEFYGFSFRIAQEPRTKWLRGNDSTQTVKANSMISPVTYVTKYNNIAGAETKLEWLDAEVDGIELKKTAGTLTDTLVLSGTANVPTGEYRYAVVAYYNGEETSRAEGKFTVKYEIKAITETDVVAVQDDEMDVITFRYYVYDEETDILFKWSTDEGAPGITTSTKNGVFTISGIPTQKGSYHYLITVEGGDTIQGRIDVLSSDLGVDPVLYLYKNNFAYEKDGVHAFLKDIGYNLVERKAKTDTLRSADQYAKYKWILISEDVDANNPEVFMIMRGGVNMPILNMKAFSYSHTIDSVNGDEGYADPWGEANNGSLSENGKSITVWRDDHPIFQELKKKQGDKIQLLDSIERRGLMPIKINKRGGLCLATALTRDLDNYYGDGAPETFLHEIPAGKGGGNAKYICLPIAISSSKHLTQDGKDFIKAVVKYLLNDKSSVQPVIPEITSFSIDGVEGIITPGSPNTILVEIDSLEHPNVDLTAVAPQITLSSPYVHAIPESGDTVDLSYAQYFPNTYVATDFIQRVAYEVTVVWRKTQQGIEEVYTIGEWVNVYDIFGRKVTTTNENIYTMSLPRGIYIVVTENGQTIKITR